MIVKKLKKKKIIIISLSVILLFLIIIILIKGIQNKKQQEFLKQEQERVLQYTALTDFKTMQEVALYLNCTLIKQEENPKELLQHKIYMKIPIKPYENNKNNKIFYEKLIQYSAYVLKYENFVIIDEENKNTITVYCNKDAEKIEKYFINDSENFFDIKESEQNVENITKITKIKVNTTSDELNKIINNKWETNNLDLGTKETTYRKYDIYFDEGFEIRRIDGKVFNIVFTEKYEKNVINNLNTKSTKQEIINSLGEPHFTSSNLIGYKCENLYVFFYNNQISIYRIEKYETEKIAQIIEKNIEEENITELINEIKSEWKDYDIYENDKQSVLLQYSLKGIKISYDSTTRNGIIFYNNYEGKAFGNTSLDDYISKKEKIPSNIYIENEDLVFKTEINRVNTLDDVTNNYNYTSSATLNISAEFKVYAKKIKNGNFYEIRFISIGNKYPSTQLRETISSGIWLDNYNFIYSISGNGIYKYNAKTREYKTIITGKSQYKIKKVENNILYYDETSVDLNL